LRVTCINDVDTPWRKDYLAYQARPRASGESILQLQNRYPHLFPAQYASDQSEYKVRKILLAPCLPTAKEQMALQDSLPVLLPDVQGYAQILRTLETLNAKLDFENRVFGGLKALKQSDINGRIQGPADQLLEASAALRQSVEHQDRDLRRRQLGQLEARFGQDAHWHLLNFMVQIRESQTLLSEGAAQLALNPAALQDIRNSLFNTRDQTRDYLTSHPRTLSSQDAHRIWQGIEPQVNNYLLTLNTFQENWNAHAPPSQLSDDFEQVNQRYDTLLHNYNQWADAVF
jgi:hypothetical protein